MYREGIRYALENNPYIRIAGEAANCMEIFGLLKNTPADLLLMGVDIYDGIGLEEVTRKIRRDYPAIKILAIADNHSSPKVQALMEIGINGCVGKLETSAHDLEKAIRIMATRN